MKVRTPDGEIHDLPAPEAARLMHVSDAVPVAEKDSDKVETRPAIAADVETRKPSTAKK